MSQNILEVKDLHVSVQDKEILKGVDLTIGSGETHVLMGPNGAGKSTLGFALMGNPRYEITQGEIIFNGQNIEDEPADKRARAGMFMSFQNPVEVPGLSVSSFIRSAIEQRTGKRPLLFKFRKELDSKMDALHIERSYAERDLNVGFSGGEKKKAEILQLHMLAPSLAILDETDSGLDVDAVRIVSEGIRAYQEEKKGSLREEGKPSDHHPQCQNTGVPARGSHLCHCGRKDRSRRRCGSDRTDRQRRICRL